jgi:hypothetical protein
MKRFKLSADEIRPIVSGYGACMASDLITVQGMRVGFMSRERSESAVDSGWCFFAGTESEDYLDNPVNLAIYDVNTIANYDRDIVPLLGAPAGSAFERAASGAFVPVRREGR